MPFFIRNKKSGDNNRKKLGRRKAQEKRKADSKGQQLEKRGKFAPNLDEEITSEEEEDYVKSKNVIDEEEELEEETAQEKKVRLARQYLKQLQEQRAQDEEDKLDDEAISTRLREDVLEASGKLRKKIADSYLKPEADDLQVLRSKKQRLSVTCITVSTDEKYIFSGSKDSSIVKYGINGEKLGTVLRGKKGTKDSHGHSSHIYCMAISSDGKFLASGDAAGYIHIWNPETLEHLKTFKKHRRAVSGLSFRWDTHTLFSSSHDRMVMVWNLDAMAFVENLGGHQDAITGLDAFMRESCISSGGRDQSVIVYVLVEDKQLRFSGHHDSIDGVKLINERTFVTYSQDGCLGLWTTLKKRPHFVAKAVHGYQGNGLPNWVTAVATLINTDIIASGSMDGYVRLWKVDTDGHKSIKQLFSIPVPGVINSLAFTASGSHLLVGVGQEHKMGRWYTEKSARNSVVVISLKKK